MDFNAYIQTVVLGIRQLTNYRFEIWLGTITRFIGLAGLLVLWLIIYQGDKNINVQEIVSYLLVANSIRDAVDAQHLKLSKEFINEIKLGTISSHLLRPINTKLYFYFRYFGSRIVNLFFDFILLIIGISLNPPKNVLGFCLFIISIFIALGLAYCFNVLVGILAFWTTEASGLRNVANHILKVFSGSMVPLSFFPEFSKHIIMMTPFPVLAYLPAVLMSSKVPALEDIRTLLISGIWLIVLIPVVNLLWLKGIKDYDAVGI